jgi:hypothetical protein
MLRPWLVVVLLGITLSGCSSTPTDAEETAPLPTFTSTATSTAPVDDVIRTDTMHFLDAPHMTGLPPTSGEAVRVPLKPIDAADTQASFVRWTLPRPADLGLLDIEIRLFIEVQGSFANADPGGGDCFWSAALYVKGSDDSTWAVLCAGEGPLVQPGIREVTLTGSQDISLVPGGELEFSLLMATPPTPGSAAFLLTGTPDQDSRMTLVGLQLPIDTQTVLL